VLQGAFRLGQRAWLLVWCAGRVRVKGRLARGLFVEGSNKLSELLINFFRRLDGTLKLEEGVFVAAGR